MSGNPHKRDQIFVRLIGGALATVCIAVAGFAIKRLLEHQELEGHPVMKERVREFSEHYRENMQDVKEDIRHLENAVNIQNGLLIEQSTILERIEQKTVSRNPP